MQGKGGAIALLELEFAVQSPMAFGRADPAALRHDHRHRLFLDHRIHVEFARRRGLGHGGATSPEHGFGAVILAQRNQIAFQPRALARRAFQQFVQIVLFRQQRVLFAAQLHFLKLAQTAQPHVENRFGLAVGQREFGHHDRFWFILGADDLDNPVKIEIGDDVPAHQFQPVGNLVQPVRRAPHQDVDLCDHPFLQQQFQPQHAGRAPRIEHV